MVAQQVRSTRCWRSCTPIPIPIPIPSPSPCTTGWESAPVRVYRPVLLPTALVVPQSILGHHSCDSQFSVSWRRFQTQTNQGQKESTAGESIPFPGFRLFSKPSGYHRRGKEQKYQTLKSFISTTDEFTMTRQHIKECSGEEGHVKPVNHQAWSFPALPTSLDRSLLTPEGSGQAKTQPNPTRRVLEQARGVQGPQLCNQLETQKAHREPFSVLISSKSSPKVFWKPLKLTQLEVSLQ